MTSAFKNLCGALKKKGGLTRKSEKLSWKFPVIKLSIYPRQIGVPDTSGDSEFFSVWRN